MEANLCKCPVSYDLHLCFKFLIYITKTSLDVHDMYILMLSCKNTFLVFKLKKCYQAEAHLEPSKTSKMNLFAQIVNSRKFKGK